MNTMALASPTHFKGVPNADLQQHAADLTNTATGLQGEVMAFRQYCAAVLPDKVGIGVQVGLAVAGGGVAGALEGMWGNAGTIAGAAGVAALAVGGFASTNPNWKHAFWAGASGMGGYNLGVMAKEGVLKLKATYAAGATAPQAAVPARAT